MIHKVSYTFAKKRKNTTLTLQSLTMSRLSAATSLLSLHITFTGAAFKYHTAMNNKEQHQSALLDLHSSSFT